MSCGSCGKATGLAFECIECCVRWLSRMKSREEIQINAPVIEKVMGSEHMEKVRQAYRERIDERNQAKAKNQTAARFVGVRR